MSTELITYDGRVVAVCTPRRAFLTDAPNPPPRSQPGTRFVLAMCLYAGEILNARISSPYRARDARAFARALLIPAEITQRAHARPRLQDLADWLDVPLTELELELAHARRRCARTHLRTSRHARGHRPRD
jgi:hypothetical protein